MRKLLVSSIVIVLIFISNDCFGQKALDKLLDKQYKAKLKELKKNKQKVCGSSQTAEVALFKHYQKVNEGANEELVVITENCPTENLCMAKSLADAQASYAATANNFVRGRTEQEDLFDAISGEARDKFFAAYEGLISKNVSGILKKSVTFCSQSDNKYRYETYYLVNEDAALTARKKAAEQAAAEMEQTENNIKWAEKVSDFVNEKPSEN